MAAPQIPNLLSGLSRGRGRGGNQSRGPLGPRGPGETGLGISAPPPQRPNPQDRIVQKTDSDASDSRMSAVSLGYLNDEYAQHFTTNSIRRMPIINRGKQLYCSLPQSSN